MNLEQLSTNTPASEISSASFDDGSYSADLEAKSLDDILRNSPAANLLGLPEKEESLPEEDDSVPSPEDSSEEEEAPQETDDESENDLDEEEESSDSEEEKTDEDDTSTQESDVYAPDDLDLEASVLVKIDGEETAVTFSDLIKGYSTEQHLSNKGRELGDARKQMDEEYNSKIQEISGMSQASAAILYNAEQQYSKEYHEIEKAIQEDKDNDN